MRRLLTALAVAAAVVALLASGLAGPAFDRPTSQPLSVPLAGLAHVSARHHESLAHHPSGTLHRAPRWRAERRAAPGASPPSAPTNLVLYVHNAAINVTWSPPVSNGGANVTGYTIIWSPTGNTSGVASVGPTLHTWVSSLVNGQLYLFQVAARNSAGTGVFSSPASATPGTVPAAPQNLTATVSNESATFFWNPSASPAGFPILSYELNVSSGTAVTLYTNVTSPFSVVGLVDGTSYRATVRATNALGASSASSGVAFVPISVPSPPMYLNGVYDASRHAILLGWSPPSWTGGAAITNYTVHWYGTNGLQAVAHASAIDNNWTLTGAQDGVSYDFFVQASNRAGPSLYANVSIDVPPAAPGPAPSSAPLFVLAELLTVTVGVFVLLTVHARYKRSKRRYQPPAAARDTSAGPVPRPWSRARLSPAAGEVGAPLLAPTRASEPVARPSFGSSRAATPPRTPSSAERQE